MAKKLGTTKLAVLKIAIMVLVWALAGWYLLDMPLADTARIVAFWVVAVALPGFAAYKLLRLRLTPLEMLCTVFGLGLAVMTAVYFCFAPFGPLDGKVGYALAAVAAASVVVLVLKRKQSLSAQPDTGELRLALIFGAVAAGMTFLLMSATTVNPTLTGTRYYFHDTLIGVSLTTSAEQGFPMQTLQMAGIEYRYHIFYFAFTALMKMTGISSFEVVTKYSLIVIAPFLFAVFVAIAKRLLRKNSFVTVCTAVLLVVPGAYERYYLHYLYQDTLGFPYGLVFALLALLLFLRAQNTPGVYNRYHAVTAVFLFMCLGAKGALAVTVLFGICFSLLLTLIRKKDWSVVVKGLAYAVPFFLLYFLLYAGGAGDTMGWSPFYDAKHTDLFYALYEKGLPGWLLLTIAGAWRVVSFDPLTTLVFVLGIVLLRRGGLRGEERTFMEYLTGGIGIGLFLMNTFKQTGSSEQYFITGLLPLTLIAVGYAAMRLKKANRTPGRLVLACVSLAVCAFTLVSGGVQFYDTMLRNYAEEAALVGTSHAWDAFRYSRFSGNKMQTLEDIRAYYGEEDKRHLACITPQEYEAYLWIRDNTSPDAVIADGHYLQSSRYIYGTALSERGFYLEGYIYVTMEDTNHNTPEKIERDTVLRFFFTEEDEGYLASMARYGCTHIIISQWLNPGLTLSDRFCDLVYQNEVVAVYQLHPFEWR